MQTLQIDSEFMSLSVPITKEGTKKLEQSITQNGCIEPIITWKGFILDGHKRYEICQNEGIEYSVKDSDLDSREDAIISICRERVIGLNAFTPIYRYLVGKWYLSSKIINALEFKSGATNRVQYNEKAGKAMPVQDRSSSEISSVLNISVSSIQKFGVFATVMDRIRKIDPTLFNEVLSGKTFIAYQKLLRHIHDDNKMLTRFCSQYSDSDKFRMRDVTTRQRSTTASNSSTLSVGVKTMPVIDPDRDLRGLTFTVPMWISSISRAMEHTDINKATDTAKAQLSDALLNLIVQINITLEALQ